MKVSIVIAVEEINDFVRDNVRHCLVMNYDDFEILLFVSRQTNESFPKTRIIVRPELAFNPAQRRDLAISEASGEILAFIDDDAYPSYDWLTNALAYFDDLTIAAVGGPGVTPSEDDLRRQVSGWSSASPLGGGPSISYRFIPSRKREVQDYPSMNLIVRKSDFTMVGGFDSNYWPGEDTKLCLDLMLKIGKRIIYDPKVLVYHHRRPIFKEHLKQNGRYGFHRGYFARILPQTSRLPHYFLPSAFALFFILTPSLAVLTGVLKPLFSNGFTFFRGFLFDNIGTIYYLYFTVLTFYLILLSLNSIWIFKKSKSLKVALFSVPTVFLTHLWYGFQFIRGFTAKEIKR